MALWAIADLHLSLARPDRRERYAARWRDHADKIEAQWREAVARDDLVLLPGDLSMARNHRDLQPDLAWIDRLPGTKILSPGNHDAWWNGAESIRPMLRRSMMAVGGDAISTHGVVVCGTLGAPVLDLDDPPDPSQIAASDRELAELDRAMSARFEDQASRRAALRPLALPAVRPAPPTRPLHRAIRGRRGHGLRLWAYRRSDPGAVVAGRPGGRSRDPLPLRRRRRHRLPPAPARPAPGCFAKIAGSSRRVAGRKCKNLYYYPLPADCYLLPDAVRTAGSFLRWTMPGSLSVWSNMVRIRVFARSLVR